MKKRTREGSDSRSGARARSLEGGEGVGESEGGASGASTETECEEAGESRGHDVDVGSDK